MYKRFIFIAFLLTLTASSSVLGNSEIDSLKALTKTVNSKSSLSFIYYKLSRLYTEDSLQKSLEYAELSANTARETKDHKRLANACFQLGYLYDVSDDVGNAVKFYLKARESYKISGQDLLYHMVTENIGTIALNNREFKMAAKFYMEALEVAQDINSYKEVADAYRNLGLALVKGGELDSASNYYINGIELIENNFNRSDTTLLSQLWLQSGIVREKLAESVNNLEYKKREWNKAREYYSTALVYNRSDLFRSIIDNNIGTLHLRMGEWEFAKDRFKNSIRLKKELSYNSRLLITPLNALGIVYYNLQKFDSAITYFNKSLEHNAQHLNDTKKNIIDKRRKIEYSKRDELRLTSLYLDSIYRTTGNASIVVQSSINISMSYNELVANKDILNAVETSDKVALTFQTYSNRKVEEAKRQQLLINIVMASAVIAMIVIGITYLRNTRKRKIKSEIKAAKNRIKDRFDLDL